RPVDGALLVPVLLQLLHAGQVLTELRVAAHAGLHRRHAGGRRAVRAGVAVEALDLVLARVQRVAEGNRLGGAGRIRIARPLLRALRGFARLVLRADRSRTRQADDQAARDRGGAGRLEESPAQHGSPARLDRAHAGVFSRLARGGSANAHRAPSGPQAGPARGRPGPGFARTRPAATAAVTANAQKTKRVRTPSRDGADALLLRTAGGLSLGRSDRGVNGFREHFARAARARRAAPARGARG